MDTTDPPQSGNENDSPIPETIDSPPPTPIDQDTCRICLDGPDPELGRLIKPCLCKGSISHVHVKCLQRWRSSSSKAFFECPQCKYRYNFHRTKALGIAKNPVVLGAATAVLFTAIVMMSSFVTTTLLKPFDPQHTRSTSYTFYWNAGPLTFVHDFVRSMLGIIKDQEARLYRSNGRNGPPGLIRRLVTRFLLGLPLVSAGSLVSMLSMPFVGPLQLLARWRGYRRNRDTADFATLIMIALVIFGTAKTVVKVYELTQKLAHRLLLRAEDAVLEVS